MKFAEDTAVSEAKSRAEIEVLLTRYGADSFGTFSESGRSAVVCRVHGRSVRVYVPMPRPDDFTTKEFRGRKVKTTPEERQRMCDQERRRRWRALHLVVKAKLEAIACGISTFDNEFLAFLVLGDGSTVGEVMGPSLAKLGAGKAPLMLPSALSERVADE